MNPLTGVVCRSSTAVVETVRRVGKGEKIESLINWTDDSNIRCLAGFSGKDSQIMQPAEDFAFFRDYWM